MTTCLQCCQLLLSANQRVKCSRHLTSANCTNLAQNWLKIPNSGWHPYLYKAARWQDCPSITFSHTSMPLASFSLLIFLPLSTIVYLQQRQVGEVCGGIGWMGGWTCHARTGFRNAQERGRDQARKQFALKSNLTHLAVQQNGWKTLELLLPKQIVSPSRRGIFISFLHVWMPSFLVTKLPNGRILYC